MKQLFIQLRMLIAEELLTWVGLYVAPSGEEGDKLRECIIAYLEQRIAENTIDQPLKRKQIKL